MARIKPTADPKSASKSSKGSAKSAGREAEPGIPRFVGVGHALARRRAKALVVVLAAVGVALVGRAIWQRVEPLVVARDRYLLPASAITATSPPEWIIADVRSQVIESAGLDRRVSILDDGFVPIIKGAFELHPWVASVTRIEKRYPPAVNVELDYRRPVAVVEEPVTDGLALLPVDNRSVMLPPDDVPLIRRKYLPRITGIVGQPRAGQRWDDPRVAGAVDLAARLADVWDTLHLAEIVPSARPEVQGDSRYFVYDLVTQGGTRIVWGAAPEAGVPGEAKFGVKRQRLEQCSREHGPFDTIESPDIINIRGGISITPRQAKNANLRQAYLESHHRGADASIRK